jgi:phytoene dehydrogenase-like protein
VAPVEPVVAARGGSAATPTDHPGAAAVMGKVGSPPLAELVARAWDVIVVGAGHNGLTSAAYLARAGKRVLVLEARDTIGGACTLEETWPGYRVSPCAYLAGLLHPLVIEELELRRRGFRWIPAPGMFVPFEDGTSLQLSDDPERNELEIARLAPRDVAGYAAMEQLVSRVAAQLRPPDERDVWLGRAPSRDELADRVEHDEQALGLLFTWSQAELLGRFLEDERLRSALMGQGVIGTNASPFDPGTASIHLHHSCGRMEPDLPGVWGFVEGGMGMVSFLLHDAAVEAGAVVATSVGVARVVPQDGVLLDDGTWLHAAIVVINADPKVALRLLGDDADPAWREQVEGISTLSATAKVTLALSRPPEFLARPRGDGGDPFGQINTPLTDEQWRTTFATASRGELPELLWTEDYLQTTLDPSVAPAGKHLLSVFTQYVPYHLRGGWDARREEVGEVAIRSIARFCDGFEDSIEAISVLGPPDIEAKLGLTGGHIFHGELLPDQMWDRRLGARTPMPGVYLCGAGTYPGGSVMAVNGRNAAMEVIAAAQVG